MMALSNNSGNTKKEKDWIHQWILRKPESYILTVNQGHMGSRTGEKGREGITDILQTPITSQTLYRLPHFPLTTAPWSRDWHHFTHEGTEAQSDYLSCPLSRKEKINKSGLKPRSVCSKSHTLSTPQHLFLIFYHLLNYCLLYSIMEMVVVV